MTSEVAVMNRLAVALAADSASTVQSAHSQKIWNSANKLFALSKHQPVGVMVYNDASLMGVPWETIIKMYRTQLGKTSFPTLEEYGNDFLCFLDQNALLFPRETQLKYFSRQFDSLLRELRSQANKQFVQATLAQEPNPDESLIFAELVDSTLAHWEGYPDLNTSPAHTEEALLRELEAVVDSCTSAVAADIALQDVTRNKLKALAVLLVTKDEFLDDYTGIVFAGFGEREHFPTVQDFKVGGVVLDHLKRSRPSVDKASDEKPSIVKPFAQSQMIETFLEGINPTLRTTLVRAFVGLAISLPEAVIDAIADLTDEQKEHWKQQAANHSQTAIKRMLHRLTEHRFHRHWAPVHAALIHLPKDELAHVAESLVNLNSFQKRVSMEEETVGGPIDVAVISKGDGFIWIKRKHYFSRELNDHFFYNQA